MTAHLAVFLATFLLLVLCQANAIAQDKLAARPDSTADASSANPRSANSTEEEVQKLKIVVADQQKRIEQLEHVLDEQKKLIELALHPHIASTGPVDETPSVGGPQPASPPGPAALNPSTTKTTSDDQTSPLSLRIGQVSVTPYGFVDLTAILRDKDIASGLSTNFGSIPSLTRSLDICRNSGSLRRTRESARASMHIMEEQISSDLSRRISPGTHLAMSR